jgi:hypothetical protein
LNWSTESEFDNFKACITKETLYDWKDFGLTRFRYFIWGNTKVIFCRTKLKYIQWHQSYCRLVRQHLFHFIIFCIIGSYQPRLCIHTTMRWIITQGKEYSLVGRSASPIHRPLVHYLYMMRNCLQSTSTASVARDTVRICINGNSSGVLRSTISKDVRWKMITLFASERSPVLVQIVWLWRWQWNFVYEDGEFRWMHTLWQLWIHSKIHFSSLATWAVH